MGCSRLGWCFLGDFGLAGAQWVAWRVVGHGWSCGVLCVGHVYGSVDGVCVRVAVVF